MTYDSRFIAAHLPPKMQQMMDEMRTDINTALALSPTVADGSITTTKLGGDITSQGKALLDDANAAAQRTTLGLGTAAILNTGTANGNMPILGSGGAQIVQAFSIANNGVYTVAMPSADSVVMALIGSTGQQHGLFIARMGGGPFFSGTANFAGTSGVLTGSTGASGKITVSTSGSTLYIENRLGYPYVITLAAFHNGT